MPLMTRRRLSAAERRTYDDQGYVVVPRVFPADELEAIDTEIDRLLTEPGNDAGGIHPTWVSQVARRSELARRFAEDERLLALIEEIVQPGIAIHSTKLVPKPPHSDDVCHWHQDDAFYIKPDDPGTFSQTRMSVWRSTRAAIARSTVAGAFGTWLTACKANAQVRKSS